MAAKDISVDELTSWRVDELFDSVDELTSWQVDEEPPPNPSRREGDSDDKLLAPEANGFWLPLTPNYLELVDKFSAHWAYGLTPFNSFWLLDTKKKLTSCLFTN